MPKRQASLDFVVSERTISSQYDLDGQLAMRIEIDRPRFAGLPIAGEAASYSAFRGMLMKSRLYFRREGGPQPPVLTLGAARHR